MRIDYSTASPREIGAIVAVKRQPSTQRRGALILAPRILGPLNYLGSRHSLAAPTLTLLHPTAPPHPYTSARYHRHLLRHMVFIK